MKRPERDLLYREILSLVCKHACKHVYIWVGSRSDVIDCDIEVRWSLDRCFTVFALVLVIKFRPASSSLKNERNSRYKDFIIASHFAYEVNRLKLGSVFKTTLCFNPPLMQHHSQFQNSLISALASSLS